MIERARSSNEGMALVLALLFIAIALIGLAALTSRLVNQQRAVSVYEDFELALHGVEAAVAQSRASLESGGNGIIGLAGWNAQYDASKAFVWPAKTDGNPSELASNPSTKYMAYAVNWFTDNRDSNGDGDVDDPSEQFMYSIYALASEGQATRRVEVVLKGYDVNVWRNAIFAGAGQAGGLINGNVSIHGSVHLLGENLLPGNAAIAAMDLSGTSLIHNNYVGMPASLASRIPALPTVNYMDENVQSLNAVLRVKQGRVGLSGNSEVGEENISGNAVKETMDGIYVNDGWMGTAVIPDGDRGDPKSVFSDNGWDELYDLGDKVKLPTIKDDWRWPVTGDKEFNPSTGTYYTHEDYFNQVLVANPSNPTDGVLNQNVVLDTKGSHFYWNATQNILSTNLPATLPPATDDYILFNKDTDVLRVNGQIRINGSLKFTGSGNQRTINYSGRAAILAYGDITIDTDLLTCNDGNTASTAQSFPVNNCIGLMTTENMVVGSTAQCSIAGAFYAAKQIKSMKQTNVLGTFVSNYFDMGTNVPSIFQVPSLADNLPLGMVGNYPILSLQQKAWREIGIKTPSES